MLLFRGRWEENPIGLIGHTASTLVAVFSPTIYHKPAPGSATATTAATTASTLDAAANGGATVTAATPPSPAGKPPPKAGHQVVAIAGQDRVVTVWLAAANRPVAILREVFDKPPSDLSWGKDGYTLVVSGHDGTVVVLRFTPEELGLPLPEVRALFVFVQRGQGVGRQGVCLYVCVWRRRTRVLLAL